MALDPVKNFAIVTLASGYSDVATSVNLIGGDGAKLPTPSIDGNFNMVYWNATDYANPSDDPNKEIVRVTNRSTDNLTITRAQEGTAATNKNTGGKTYKMILAFTKKMRDDIDSLLSLDTDGTLAANSDTKIASQKAVKTYTAPMSEFITGWHDSGETPTYNAIDSPTGVITVASGAKTKYPIGCKLKFDQSQALSYYWSFDSSSAADLGTATMGNVGTPTYSAGKFSNALTLNGTDQALTITDAAGFKPTGEFTIGCWFKTSATGAQRSIFQSYSANANAQGLAIGILSTNVLYLVIGNNTSASPASVYGTTVVTDGNNHYLSMSVRNNYAQIYLDGKLEASGYVPTPVYAATNYVRVGCLNTTGSNSAFWSGQIDDLFLINGYALDQDTIKAKYDAVTAQGTGSITVTKKGIVTATTDTTVTAYYGTDYTLANSAITNFYYSLMRSPLGFPLNENKWVVEFSSSITTNQASPVSGTKYNVNSNLIPIPIGVWSVHYEAGIYSNLSSAGNARIFSTLSTANNSESDPDFTCFSDANSVVSISSSVFRRKTISLIAKSNYYLNLWVDVASVQNVYILGAQTKTIIRAVCAYL